MSERINARDNRASIRWKLLSGVSALALTAYVSSINIAKAEDVDHPVLWIELGDQFESESNPAQTWMPPNVPPPIVEPTFAPFGTMPRIGYNWDGSISLQPDVSGWTFSAAIQFGRTKRGPKSTHDQGNPSGYNLFSSQPAPATYAFTDSHSAAETKHLILDFQAGKDLGLGLFGSHGSSSFNFGVRVAQFTEHASGSMTAQVSAVHKYNGGVGRHADIDVNRSFNGVGPSIDWKASLPFTGSLADGFALDWGANAAILFGRQKADVRMHTKSVRYITGFSATQAPPSYLLTESTSEPIRKKQVIVPNIGGFAGISYNLHGDAKISFGYRAEFFFNAIDGGIATRKTENRSFQGPFARLSVGLGD